MTSRILKKSKVLLVKKLECISCKNAEIEKLADLELAVSDRNTEEIKQILKKGVNLRVKNEFGENCLHLVAQMGDVELIKLVFQNPKAEKYINDTDESNLTPLHVAVRRNDLKTVEYLLEKNANPNIEDAHAMTPLFRAFFNKCSPMGNLLSRHGGILADPENLKNMIYKSYYLAFEMHVDVEESDDVEFCFYKYKSLVDISFRLDRLGMDFSISYELDEDRIQSSLFWDNELRAEEEVKKDMTKLFVKRITDLDNGIDKPNDTDLHDTSFEKHGKGTSVRMQILLRAKNLEQAPLLLATAKITCERIVDSLLSENVKRWEKLGGYPHCCYDDLFGRKMLKLLMESDGCYGGIEESAIVLLRFSILHRKNEHLKTSY